MKIKLKRSVGGHDEGTEHEVIERIGLGYVIETPLGEISGRVYVDARDAEVATTGDSTEALLTEREKTSGDYVVNAEITEDILRALEQGRNWATLPAPARMSLRMFAFKMHRIVNGDWTLVDHWDDIAGYAKLIPRNMSRLAKVAAPVPRREAMDENFAKAFGGGGGERVTIRLPSSPTGLTREQMLDLADNVRPDMPRDELDRTLVALRRGGASVVFDSGLTEAQHVMAEETRKRVADEMTPARDEYTVGDKVYVRGDPREGRLRGPVGVAWVVDYIFLGLDGDQPGRRIARVDELTLARHAVMMKPAEVTLADGTDVEFVMTGGQKWWGRVIGHDTRSMDGRSVIWYEIEYHSAVGPARRLTRPASQVHARSAADSHSATDAAAGTTAAKPAPEAPAESLRAADDGPSHELVEEVEEIVPKRWPRYLTHSEFTDGDVGFQIVDHGTMRDKTVAALFELTEGEEAKDHYAHMRPGYVEEYSR